jgi:hypothetical protein
MEKKTEKREYVAPQVKDLRELSLYGQFPLATHGCDPVGSGNTDHTCADFGTDDQCVVGGGF